MEKFLASVSSRQLTEWMAYERVEGPIGFTRHDFNAATISATIANAFRSKKDKAAKHKDFMPQWDKPPQTIEQQMGIFKRMRMAFEAARGRVKS